MAEPGDEGDRLYELHVLGDKQREDCTATPLAAIILTPAFPAAPIISPLYDRDRSRCSGAVKGPCGVDTEESPSGTETERTTKDKLSGVQPAFFSNMSILIFFFIIVCLLGAILKV